MSFLDRLRTAYRALVARPGAVSVRGRYDAARTGDDNRKHWAEADAYGPVRANSPEVRRTLRNRARYERANNSYLCGLVQTLAHDAVGTGPRLQLSAPAAARPAARRVERAFADWVRAAHLADKLRVMYEAGVVDGESFGVALANPRLAHPVKLDLAVIEAERVAAPWAAGPGGDPADGIEFDAHGNPVRYTVLNTHPGESYARPGESENYPASRVVHWFRPDRPGQVRGVSRLAPALTLAPMLRRYTRAVLTAAELAAVLAGVMKTDAPAADTGPDIDSMDRVELEPGALLTLPAGWSAEQFKPEQPTSTYKEFKGEILNEMGRCLNAPFNVIAGNSSGYNYSSGRLDHQVYHRSVWIERERLRHRVLDPLFRQWLTFAGMAPELDGLFAGLPPVAEWAWDWHWDGFASIDPLKDATATETRLRLHLTTLAEECAADGKDWQEVLGQRAAEAAELARLGLPDPTAPAPAPPPAPPPAPAPAEDAADA